LNYYQHHIGDYARDTAHLTPLEDLAYRRMLDLYYASERPLPGNRQGLYRLLRLRTKEEIKAVDSILEEFFAEVDGSWHNKRADEEIAKWQSKAAKAKSSAAHRWHSEGNANASANAMRTHTEGNANQEPITKNQEPEEQVAPSAPALWPPASPVVLGIPLNDGTEYPITEALTKEWEDLYPRVDVLQTLREIRGWNVANPKNRKTKSGVLKHVNTWLAKEQNKGA
jgi:uncharacterized protein YdaU (DUF1376 family)